MSLSNKKNLRQTSLVINSQHTPTSFIPHGGKPSGTLNATSLTSPISMGPAGAIRKAVNLSILLIVAK